MEYHITKDGQQEGPLSLEEINQRLSEGALSPTDLGWCESTPDWTPLQDIPGVVVTIPGAPWGTEPAQPKSKGGLVTVLIIVLVVSGLSTGGWFLWQKFGNNPKPPPQENNATDNNATDDNKTDVNATTPISKIDPSPAGVITLTGHTNTITSLSFSPDGRFLVSGDAGGGLYVWDAESGASRFSTGQPGAIMQVMFAGNNPAFFALSDQQMALWSVPQKKIMSQATKPPTGFASAVLNPQQPGDYFATGGADGRLELWNTKGEKQYTQRGHTNAISAIKFFPNGSHLVTGGKDHQVKVWQANNGKLVGSLTSHISPITCLSVHATSNIFASASEDGAIFVWDGSTMKSIRRLTGHQGPVLCVAINPVNTQYVASGGQGRAFIYWDLKNKEKPILGKLSDHAGPVTAIAFAPNGSRMATGSADKTIKVRPLN